MQNLAEDSEQPRKSRRFDFLNRLSWKEADAKPALLSALLLFLIVAAFVVLKTIRDASFLSAYPAQKLPQYMALNTVVSAVIAFVLLRLYKYIPLRRLLQGALMVFAIGSILFWEVSPVHLPIKPTMFYIWVGIYGTIIPVQAWALVSMQLSSRQAKRTLGWIGSGAILGGIAGGALARTLVIEWGLQSLFPCAALIMVVAFFFSPAASGSLTETTPPEIVPPDKKRIGARYIFLLVIIVATGTIVSTFLDFQFKAYTQREYVSETKLGSFLGSFYALLGIATFIFQVLITPIVIKRVGLAAGLAAMPFLLFLGSGVLYFRKTFYAVVMLRGSEELLKHSLDRSSFEVVQLAMPAYQKMRLKSLLDTVGIRVSELTASLVLVALFTSREIPLTTLTIVNLVLTFLWFAFALLLGLREYPNLLRNMLRREELDLEALRENLFTNDFHRTLPVLLRNADKDTVLRILELLEADNKNWIGRFLTSIHHSDPDVRLKTLQLLFLQKSDLSRRVRRLLSDPDPRVRAEAVHYLSVRARSPKQFMQKFKKDESLAVRAAACAPGLKVKSEEAYNEMEDLLKIAEKEQDEITLQEIAHLLQFVPQADFSIKIYKQLLARPSLEVRTAALRSIGFVKPPALIPILLKLTRVPVLKSEVLATLGHFDEKLIPFLKEIIRNPGDSTPRRKLALKVAADSGGSAILDSVLKAAEDPNVSLRFSAIKTLNQFRSDGVLTSDHPALPDLVDREIALLESELMRASAFAPEPDRLIHAILKQQILRTIERIFRLLAMISDPDVINNAFYAWKSEDARKREAAIELLDHTITPDLRDRFIPLIENTAEQTSIINPETDRAEAFLSLLNDQDPLLTAAAILELNAKEWNRCSAEIKRRLDQDPNVLIEEAVGRRSSAMNNDEKTTPLTVLEKIEILSRIDLFSRLAPQELLLLSEVATEMEFDEETVIYKEGDPPEEMFCLIRGKVELVREEERIASPGAGEVFGSLEILTGKNRVCSATVVEKAHCLRISGERFWEILEDYEPVSHGVIEVLAQRIEDLIKEKAESKSRGK